ncbi:MAG: hypothetical protein ABI779_10455 [Acidobacteriota bacterium]
MKAAPKHPRISTLLMRACTVVLCLALAFVLAAAPAERRLARSDEAYAYPIQPGSPEWEALDSHAAMLRATSVPQARLRGMTTRALAETVLTYPLFGDVFAYNTAQTGFDAVRAQSPAVEALLQRKDAGSVLLLRYQSMHPADAIDLATDQARGAFDAEFTAIETVLAQPEIQASLSPSERDQLLRTAVAIADAKAQVPDVYGSYGVERTALVVGRLRATAFHDTDIETFLKDGGYLPDDKAELLLRMSSEAIRVPSPSLRVGPTDYRAEVLTPRKSRVEVIARDFELTRVQITQANDFVRTRYPKAVRETDASRRYNCHSYAWYSQSTSNTYWMNSPGDDTYWKDGSYLLITSVNGGKPIPNTVPDNAKVSYPMGDHSAIKISSTELRSKWGELPRMRHQPGYSPYACGASTACSFILNYYRAR